MGKAKSRNSLALSRSEHDSDDQDRESEVGSAEGAEVEEVEIDELNDDDNEDSPDSDSGKTLKMVAKRGREQQATPPRARAARGSDRKKWSKEASNNFPSDRDKMPPPKLTPQKKGKVPKPIDSVDDDEDEADDADAHGQPASLLRKCPSCKKSSKDRALRTT
jgi:hypothetical protein